MLIYDPIHKHFQRLVNFTKKQIQNFIVHWARNDCSLQAVSYIGLGKVHLSYMALFYNRPKIVRRANPTVLLRIKYK